MTTNTNRHYKWYVLYAEGTNIREVIVGGPFTTCEEATQCWATTRRVSHEVALLDTRKVSRHLNEELRLREWLITRSCHNPFQ